MPTLTWADGFHHNTPAAERFGGATDTGIFSAINRPAGVSFANETYGSAPDLQIVQDGINFTNVQRGIPASNRMVVASFYFKLPSGAPSVASRMFMLTGPTTTLKVWIETNGTISVGNNAGETIGPNVADAGVHRLDLRYDTSGTTFTVDWAVDGSAQTQATLAGQTAADMTLWQLGSGSSPHTLTCRYWHYVMSYTSGDHPIGDHRVNVLPPTGDGTHNSGTDIMEDQAGTDIVSPNAFPLINEWPAETTDYIRAFAAGAGNYAEVTFDDVSETTIWAVTGFAALRSDGTDPNSGTTRIVSCISSMILSMQLAMTNCWTATGAPSRSIMFTPSWSVSLSEKFIRSISGMTSVMYWSSSVYIFSTKVPDRTVLSTVRMFAWMSLRECAPRQAFMMSPR